MIVYKVTDWTGSSIHAPGPFKKQYTIGETVSFTPGLGPMMAFSSLQSARNWQCPGDRIFKCRARVSRKKIKYIANKYYKLALMKAFWKDRCYLAVSGTQSRVNLRIPPAGTVFCDTVTPLKGVVSFD